MSDPRLPFSPRRLLSFVVTAALCLALVAVGSGTAAADDETGAIRDIALETPNENHVILGDLASRSQRKPIEISGIGPYTIRGEDSRTGESYSYFTDWNYDASEYAAWGVRAMSAS